MMLKYLHDSHAHKDSQDDSTVFQKPLLHAVDAALGGWRRRRLEEIQLTEETNSYVILARAFF